MSAPNFTGLDASGDSAAYLEWRHPMLGSITHPLSVMGIHPKVATKGSALWPFVPRCRSFPVRHGCKQDLMAVALETLLPQFGPPRPSKSQHRHFVLRRACKIQGVPFVPAVTYTTRSLGTACRSSIQSAPDGTQVTVRQILQTRCGLSR